MPQVAALQTRRRSLAVAERRSPAPCHATGAICSSPTGRAASAQPRKPGRAGATPRLFERLRENLAKTRQALGSEIQATLFATIDEHTWERLEEALIMADVGATTTAAVIESSRRRPAR